MGLVHELLDMIWKKDVLEIVGRARQVALTLDATTIDRWLRCEFEGYGDDNTVPNYRSIQCSFAVNPNGYVPIGYGQIANGYMPIPQLGTVDQTLCHSLPTLLQMSRGPDVQFFDLNPEEVSPELYACVPERYRSRVTFALAFPVSQVRAIPDAVKSKIHSWACDLAAKGIYGEEAKFKQEEKIAARRISLQLTDCIFHGPSILSAIGGQSHMTNHSIDTGGGALSVSGDLIQARDITRSFNELAAKAGSADISENLRKLALSLNEILAKLPDDVAERIARQAKSFAEEAASKKPEPEALESCWGTLKATLAKAAKDSIPLLAPFVVAIIKSATGV